MIHDAKHLKDGLYYNKVTDNYTSKITVQDNQLEFWTALKSGNLDMVIIKSPLGTFLNAGEDLLKSDKLDLKSPILKDIWI